VGVDHIKPLTRRSGWPARQVVGVADDEFNVADLELSGALAGLSDHLGFAVDPHDPARCYPLGQVDGDGARSAPHVQHIHTGRS